MAATVTSCDGRCDTTMSSPADTDPGATTQRYAPGIEAAVKVLSQPGMPIQPRNVEQGTRGEVTSSTSSSPIVHRSPLSAPLTSIPIVVRFSPNDPDVRVRPSSRSQ